MNEIHGIESAVALDACEFVPMRDDDIPGMPEFKVKGRLSLPSGEVLEFDGAIAIETDGRDIEWEGTPSYEEFADWETNGPGDIADAVWKTPAWKQAEVAHGLVDV